MQTEPVLKNRAPILESNMAYLWIGWGDRANASKFIERESMV